MGLSGTTVLVTGGSSGIGAATARALAAAGARVLVAGRNTTRLRAVAAETGGLAIEADLAAPDGPARLARAALQAVAAWDSALREGRVTGDGLAVGDALPVGDGPAVHDGPTACSAREQGGGQTRGGERVLGNGHSVGHARPSAGGRGPLIAQPARGTGQPVGRRNGTASGLPAPPGVAPASTDDGPVTTQGAATMWHTTSAVWNSVTRREPNPAGHRPAYPRRGDGADPSAGRAGLARQGSDPGPRAAAGEGPTGSALGQNSRAPSLQPAVAGGIDILINNAGIGWAGPLTEMSAAKVAQLVAVNLTAPIELTRLLAPTLAAGGRGRVVFISSIAGATGVPQEAVYAATKAGLNYFAESLRYELAGSGVGVSVVVPGVIDTPFFAIRGTPYTRSRPAPISAQRVARAVLAAIEREQPMVFVPRWLRFPAWLHGAAPSAFRALAARFG